MLLQRSPLALFQVIVSSNRWRGCLSLPLPEHTDVVRCPCYGLLEWEARLALRRISTKLMKALQMRYVSRVLTPSRYRAAENNTVSFDTCGRLHTRSFGLLIGSINSCLAFPSIPAQCSEGKRKWGSGSGKGWFRFIVLPFVPFIAVVVQQGQVNQVIMLISEGANSVAQRHVAHRYLFFLLP